MDIGTIGGVLGIVAVIGAAMVVLRSAVAKETLAWQDRRIVQLQQDGERCKTDIAKLKSENATLTEKLTQAAAVDALTKVLSRMLDENKSEHAQLAAMIGTWRAEERQDREA